MEIGIIVSKLIRMENIIMENRPIEPFREVIAYEALRGSRGAGFKSLSALFSTKAGSRPSDFVDADTIHKLQGTINDIW